MFTNRSFLTRQLGVLLLLTCLATLIYSNTFSSHFHFDDRTTILENSKIKQFPPNYRVWESRFIGFFTFALNYRLGRLEVFGYHLVNLLIHITNGFLVYTLVRLLCGTPGIRLSLSPQLVQRSGGVALVTALLFVAHPIQTQAVTYIAQRFTSLATLFYLLAVVCYLRWRSAEHRPVFRRLWYAGALAATILAMLTKEISFTLPFTLLVVEGVCFRPPTWKRWPSLLPFFLTLPIIPLALAGQLADVTRENPEIGRLNYLLTQFRVLVTYLRLLILPIHQSVDYEYPVYHSFLAPQVFLSFSFLLALGVGAVYSLRSSSPWRLVGVGLMWFFVTISVESSIIPIRDVLVEHRLYLPSVGLFLAASVGGGILLGQRPASAMIVAGLVLASSAIATYHRNAVWKDEVTLWTNAVERNPQNARAHTSLGAAYSVQRRFDAAVTEHLTALRLKPTYAEGHNLLGVVYAKQRKFDEAASAFATAVRLRPDFAEARNNLAKVYARQDRPDAAMEEFLIALQLKPDLPEAHYHLGNIYATKGRLDEAIAELETALRLDPDYAEAHYSLGTLYAEQGRTDQAIQEFVVGLRLKPDLLDTNYRLGILYAAQGRLDEAITEYSRALQLAPDSPEIHNDLGTVYARQGHMAKAADEFLIVVRLRPDFPEAHYNLGSAYAHQGNLDEAITQYQAALDLRPDFVGAHYDLGTVYKLKGMTEKAKREFEAALRLEPGLSAAHDALRSLQPDHSVGPGTLPPTASPPS
jgi:tetratricopeptide (TPR) repeat protein